MPILLDSNWFALNESRAYPLDDAATAYDDSGNPLPTDILVDASLRWPDSLGVTAYLSAAAVTAGTVTLVFQASPNVATISASDGLGMIQETGQPLAAVSVPQPAEEYTAYAVTPLLAGVSGWVVFGRGVSNPYSGRFSTPAQGAVLPRCAAGYPPPPVSGIGQPYLPILQDLVTLVAGTDVNVDIETIAIPAVDLPPTQMIVFRLASAIGRNVYQDYAGPCGGRPESNSCGLPDILQLAGVEPDPATGNIDISFPGATVYPMAGGLAISVASSLASTCPDNGLPDPTTGVLSGQGSSFCGGAVYFGATPPAGFTVISGVFSSSASGYLATDGGPNLSVTTLDPPPTTFSVSMTLGLGDGGLNGALAFGYSAAGYCVAMLDGFTGDLSIATVPPLTNPVIAASTHAGAIPTPHNPYPWNGVTIQLDVTLAPSPTAGMTHVTARLVALAGYAAVSADIPVDTSGQFGVAAYGAMTTFLSLQVS